VHSSQRALILPLPRLYAVVLAFTAALAFPMQTSAQVHGPRLVSSRTPDLHDLESYVQSIVKPGMTQKERAMALWRATCRQMYHWNNPVEYPLIEAGQFLDVTDPIRLMNVYGYTLCFCSAAGMEAVWRQAGLEGREFGLPGHVASEAWFDGAYHYLDMEFKGYLTRSDGLIASARECGLKPAEVVLSSRIPPDFFPLTRYPFRSYLSKMVFAGLLDGGPSWYASHRAQSGHVMHVSLRPGECYYRAWDNVGRFVNDYRRWVEPGEFGTTDCRHGPHELDGPLSFGNGVIIYEPDLTKATDEFERGVFSSRGLVKTDRGLGVASGDLKGECVFRVQVPYVICGRAARLDDPESASDAALVSLQGTGQIETQVSVDNGRTWLPAAGAPGRIDLTRFVERRYGYQVRFRLKSGAEITGLRIDTYFQLAQTSLPALAGGTNTVTFNLDDAGEMIEWTVPTWESEQAFTSSAWKLDNLKWTGEWTTAVQPADRSREGSAIFEIKAPPGKVLTRVSADVGGSMNNTGIQVPEDRIDVFGSAGSPTDFRLLGSVQAPPYGEHWTRRLPVTMSFEDRQLMRRAYLKVRMFSKVRAALSDMRIRYFVKDGNPRPAQTDRLVITHGWLEGGRVHSFEKRGPERGETYTVTTGEKFERPTFVCMELPGRKSGIRAGTDPLGLNDYRPRPEDEFPPEARGYLANVPILRRLDAEGLDRADAMVAILLEGTNKTLSAEVRKILGYRPDERLRSYMDRLTGTESDDDRIRRGLALLDEDRASGRDAFLRQYIPSLKGDCYGVQYVRRIGWTGSHGDTDALRDCFDRSSDAGLTLAIAEASMLLGDKSLAREAAALASQADADAQIPVDVLLLCIPDLAPRARERLASRMADPGDHIRWAVVRDMNYLPAPPKTSEAMELLKTALSDRSAQIRLEAIGVLGRRGDGQELMRKALKIETVPSVRDALTDTLDRQSP
jgi:hypothetical protein